VVNDFFEGLFNALSPFTWEIWEEHSLSRHFVPILQEDDFVGNNIAKEDGVSRMRSLKQLRAGGLSNFSILNQ